MNVYCSGGMKSGWQDKLIFNTKLINHIFFNPAKHGLDKPEQYTIWDLEKIKQCDIVFAYIELNNPSGIGLSLEIGYALALGKTVILVDEKHDPKMEIVRQSVSIVFMSLEEGIEFLLHF